MSAWTTYKARLSVSDGNDNDPKRDAVSSHLRDITRRKITASLSYKHTKISGVDRQVAIMDSSEFNIKKIFALPGETIPHGEIVEWENAFWLITEVDAHSEFCVQGKMQRCNYLLKWINTDGDIVSRWCIVEDGTKYLIGEKNSDIIDIGDARIAVTIGKDSQTNKLSRGRRFLIDDMDTDNVLAYQITKPNKLFNIYNGVGVFRFILNEVNRTDNDNVELRIADYYSWAPKVSRTPSDVKTNDTLEEIVSRAEEKNDNKAEDVNNKGVWL